MILRSLLFGCALGLMVPVGAEAIEKLGINPFEGRANAFGTALSQQAVEPVPVSPLSGFHPISQGEQS